MLNYNVFLHGVSFTLSCLIASLCLGMIKSSLSARFLLLWALCASVFIIEKILIIDFGIAVLKITLLITPLTTVFFWLFCSSLFNDAFKMKTLYLIPAVLILISTNLAFYLKSYEQPTLFLQPLSCSYQKTSPTHKLQIPWEYNHHSVKVLYIMVAFQFLFGALTPR